MAFVAPIPLIRRNHIVNKLLKKNAISPETAVSFYEAGVLNPNGFQLVTQRLIKQGVVCKFEDKYYLDVTKI